MIFMRNEIDANQVDEEAKTVSARIEELVKKGTAHIEGSVVEGWVFRPLYGFQWVRGEWITIGRGNYACGAVAEPGGAMHTLMFEHLEDCSEHAKLAQTLVALEGFARAIRCVVAVETAQENAQKNARTLVHTRNADSVCARVTQTDPVKQQLRPGRVVHEGSVEGVVLRLKAGLLQ